jgi:hypothetical protein
VKSRRAEIARRYDRHRDRTKLERVLALRRGQLIRLFERRNPLHWRGDQTDEQPMHSSASCLTSLAPRTGLTRATIEFH